MADSAIRGSSTFSVARQVANWAREVDPSVSFTEDDVLPLCVGPMRKVLSFSMKNFRSTEDIARASKAIQRIKHTLMTEGIRKTEEEKTEIRAKICESLDRQKSMSATLNEAIQCLRQAESRIYDLHEDFDGLETRERIILELSSTRRKELHLWNRTINDLTDMSQIQTIEAMIMTMKNECVNVLRGSETGILHQDNVVQNKVNNEMSFRKGNLLHQQTESELNSTLISEYLAATRMAYSVSEKLKGGCIVPEEDEDIFKNSLALELAVVKKTLLKKFIIEVESSISEISSAPLELENKKEIMKNLKFQSLDLKKKIALQAKLNLTLDKKLRELNSEKVAEEKKNFNLNSNMSIITNIYENDIHLNLTDGNDVKTILNRSNKPAKVSLGIKESPIDREIETGTETEIEMISHGSHLDSLVNELGEALRNLSEDWIDQSSVLKMTSVQSLRRIVPDTAAIISHSHIQTNQNNLPHESVGKENCKTDSILLDSFVGLTQDHFFEVPIPSEDFMSRQATNVSSSFRLLTTKLSIPSSLSAAASIQTLSAMKDPPNFNYNMNMKNMKTENCSNTTEILNPTKIQISPSYNFDKNNNDMTFKDVTALLSHSAENLHDMTYRKGLIKSDNRNQFGKEVQNLVFGLNAAADRLQNCFNDAKTLRRSLNSLHYEEEMTLHALNDFKEQPARTL